MKFLLRKKVLATALAAMLLAMLLVLSSLSVVHAPPEQKLTVLQNVQLYVPPPPPATPEPARRSTRAGAASALQVNIPQHQVKLGLMQLDTRFANVSGLPVAAGRNGANLPGSALGLGGDGFEGGVEKILQLNELDSTPTVLSSPLFTYPDLLRRRNVRSFVVQFQIYVDADGHTYPVRIIDSPDPSLDAQFFDYASRVVFTPPVQGGKKVKVQYLWPVKFVDDGLPKSDLSRRRNGL